MTFQSFQTVVESDGVNHSVKERCGMTATSRRHVTATNPKPKQNWCPCNTCASCWLFYGATCKKLQEKSVDGWAMSERWMRYQWSETRGEYRWVEQWLTGSGVSRTCRYTTLEKTGAVLIEPLYSTASIHRCKIRLFRKCFQMVFSMNVFKNKKRWQIKKR